MSKKKAKMPSASTESRRDWGRVKKEVFFFLAIMFITVMQVTMFRFQ